MPEKKLIPREERAMNYFDPFATRDLINLGESMNPKTESKNLQKTNTNSTPLHNEKYWQDDFFDFQGIC